MRDRAADPLAEFRRTNVEGTRCLARSAAKAGVKHFIYISSVMVNGAGSRVPYTEADEPRPKDPYGVSKLEAEQVLRAISEATSMKVTILRPPLVYGPCVKANFFKLLEVVRKGIPLPLASISNRRSLLYVGNLADAITSCLERPEVSAGTYLVSDGDDVSTQELIRRIAAAMKCPARLFPFPVMAMRASGRLFGQSASVERLTDSLTTDISKIRGELSWSPPYTMAEGLKRTAEWYLTRKG
jgi:nucleoside-diphosphate-sugar epimerase